MQSLEWQNMQQLYPVLQDERKTRFYRTFKIQKDRSFCFPEWKFKYITEYVMYHISWGRFAFMTSLFTVMNHLWQSSENTILVTQIPITQGRGRIWGGVSASWWNGLIILVKCLDYHAAGQTCQQNCMPSSFHIMNSSKRLSEQEHYRGYTVLIKAALKCVNK